MALLLGVDTGGTYTDAVLLEGETRVIASAKSLTTRHDLAVGIGKAVAAVLDEAAIDPAQIGMAALSTTLATNALVEGQGERVGLIFIGFPERDLETHGLSEALSGDPALVLPGGHDHAGGAVAPLDEGTLQNWLKQDHGCAAFAVASKFATRNPEHELAALEHVRAITGKPVSASHHLSAKLNGPKRALTALLNARLVGMIDRLISRAETTLQDHGVTAPLMVVRGDGALISAAQAREKPIETILSGPAASIVGARWMTGADTALVSDIGGTTTDVALLRDGRPMIDPAGARVGQWRTMVEAVAMRTTGLGGDSEVHVKSEGLSAGVILGPRRVVPVSLIATEAPDLVHQVLDDQLRSQTPGEYDARFVRPVLGLDRAGLQDRDKTVLDRIGDEVHPVSKVLKSRLEAQALKRLVGRGLVQISGVTPSDASHVLGRLDSWDSNAALKALELIGRKRTGSGNQLESDPTKLAQMIVDQLTYQTALALLEAAFAEESTDFALPPAQLAAHVLTQTGLHHHRDLLAIDMGLNVPVIGLGASANSYYPAVGTRLNCDMILPEHSGVANAIGAVVGRVTIRRMGTITSPGEGQFRLHHGDAPQDFIDQANALDTLEALLREDAKSQAETAGAEDIQITATRDIREAETEGRKVFLEAEITVEASGRPRIANETATD